MNGRPTAFGDIKRHVRDVLAVLLDRFHFAVGDLHLLVFIGSCRAGQRRSHLLQDQMSRVVFGRILIRGNDEGSAPLAGQVLRRKEIGAEEQEQHQHGSETLHIHGFSRVNVLGEW